MTTVAANPEAVVQPTRPMVPTLEGAGFTVVDLTDTRLLEDTLQPFAGLSPEAVAGEYGRAFSDPDKARRRLTAASHAAQAAIEADRGKLSLINVPETFDGQRLSPAVAFAAVDADGTVIAGYRHHVAQPNGTRKTPQDAEAIKDEFRGIGGAPAENGVVHHLLPSRLLPPWRGIRRRTLVAIKSAAGHRPAAERPVTTLYGQLASLDPELSYERRHDGYVPRGFNYGRAVTEPEMTTHNRMLWIADIARVVGDAAFGLSGERAASAFHIEPILFQSLASLAPSRESGARPDADTLRAAAVERLAAINEQAAEEPLTLNQIAAAVAAAALAIRSNSGLTEGLSANLAARHRMPEPLGPLELDEPVFVEYQSGWHFIRNLKAWSINRELQADYETAVRAHERARQARDYEIIEQEIVRRELRQRGGRMVSDLIKWRMNNHSSLLKHPLERLLHGATNSSYDMKEIVDGVQNPAQLHDLYNRVSRDRRHDRTVPVRAIVRTIGRGVRAGARGGATAIREGVRGGAFLLRGGARAAGTAYRAAGRKLSSRTPN